MFVTKQTKEIGNVGVIYNRHSLFLCPASHCSSNLSATVMLCSLNKKLITAVSLVHRVTKLNVLTYRSPEWNNSLCSKQPLALVLFMSIYCKPCSYFSESKWASTNYLEINPWLLALLSTYTWTAIIVGIYNCHSKHFFILPLFNKNPI